MNIKLGSRAENYVAKEILLEEASPPAIFKSTIYIVTFSIIIFFAWASMAQLDITSVGTGQAMPIRPVQEIQSIDGGRIAKINIREGEKVTKGQSLMTFDDLEVKTDLEAFNSRYWTSFTRYKALKSFLQKEQLNTSEVPAKFSELVKLQKLNLAQMQDQESHLESQIDLLQDVKGIRQELANQKLGTRIQAYESQVTVIQLKSELLRLRKSANQEQHVLRNELNEMEQQRLKLESRAKRIDYLSPEDGVVQDLKFKTVGGVVSSGAALMSIVPIDSEIQAELQVSPADIGFIKVGQAVKVKVTSYDFVRYGSVPGRVTMVSPMSMTDSRGNVYFNVYVNLSSKHMVDKVDKVISPGMTLEANIFTDRQSVLRYLLRPVFVALDQGMRER